MSLQQLDETGLLNASNPRGGRPQKIGTTLSYNLEPKGTLMEISEIKEDTSLRIFLGYCSCGRKVVAGERKTLILMRFVLSKLGIESFDELKERIRDVLMPYEKPKKERFWDNLG